MCKEKARETPTKPDSLLFQGNSGASGGHQHNPILAIVETDKIPGESDVLAQILRGRIGIEVLFRDFGLGHG